MCWVLHLLSVAGVRTFLSAPLTMGVMSPPGTDTAMEMSTVLLCEGACACASHVTFTSGTALSASAAALTIRSFTDTC